MMAVCRRMKGRIHGRMEGRMIGRMSPYKFSVLGFETFLINANWVGVAKVVVGTGWVWGRKGGRGCCEKGPRDGLMCARMKLGGGVELQKKGGRQRGVKTWEGVLGGVGWCVHCDLHKCRDWLSDCVTDCL